VLLAKWKLEAHQEKNWGREPVRTFDELMLHYLDGPSTRKRDQERDRYSAKQLYPIFSGRELNTLGAADVSAYIKQRLQAGIEPGTINREIGLLSTAINWARTELEWEIPNPAQGRRLKEPEGRIRWLTRPEAERLLRHARPTPHLVDFIQLGLHTGMRKGEMLGLEWSRVDLQEGLVYLGSQHQKNGRHGSVPLNARAREALLSRDAFRRKYCPDSPWVFCNRAGERIQNIKKSFATACAKAGLEDFHPHDLRHTCATWLVQAGVSIREVAELLRHSNIQVTMRYAHLAPDNVRSAVQRLEGIESRFSHSREGEL
jgi:integrase